LGRTGGEEQKMYFQTQGRAITAWLKGKTGRCVKREGSSHSPELATRGKKRKENSLTGGGNDQVSRRARIAQKKPLLTLATEKKTTPAPEGGPLPS